MNKRLMSLICSVSLMTGIFSSFAQAQDSGWPRTLSLQGGAVTIYPLQVDDLNGDRVHFRAALAYRPTGVSEPVFGAGWFESRVEIDRERGVVHPVDLKVSDTRFPAGTDDLQSELTAVFARQATSWDLDFPIDELQTSLETAEQEQKTVQNLNTDPPNIIYRDHPALLVNIDGKPIFRSIENSNYQAVINTPYPLIFDGKTYYLSAAEGAWYRADSAGGPYRFDTNPPADLVAMIEAAAKTETPQPSTEKITAANAPEIVVATKPSELIVTDGPAEFVPLVDDLLVLDNSADDVFMHISSQRYYIVLSGRWYQSASLNGPWTYRAANALPAAFANIPGDSDQADSRVYVAGTNEAQEAVLDAQIPVTAAVARGPVDMDVTYDGEPSFEPVQGTDLEYADNTASTVIQSDRQYYLVEDGVWYVSDSPNGPWEVSDYRPEEVAAIDPESPVYNVKYVYVYDSTPEYVYVGYTPGYLGSYVYYDTIVYGTGWYYRPWISPAYYYPRYSTWGFSVGYDPWNGWGFGLSWGWGPFYAGFYSGGYWHDNHYWGHHGYGHWGPGGYRPRWGHHDRYSHGGSRYGNDGHGDGNYRRGGDVRDYGRGGYAGSDDGRGGYGGRDRGRGERGGDGNGRDGFRNSEYVRNPDLYRDRGQRARVGNPGQSGQRERQGGADRVAQDNTRGGREVNPNREVRAGREPGKRAAGRMGPVTPSDLRAKVANRDALRSESIADNGRNARRMSQAPAEQREPSGRQAASEARAKMRSAESPRNPDRYNRQRAGEQVAYARSRSPELSDRAPAPVPRSANGSRKKAPVARAPEQRAMRTIDPPGNARDRGNQPRGLQRQDPPQRAMEQRGAPRQDAPQRAMEQRGAPRQDVPQRAREQRGGPRGGNQQASAPRGDNARRGGDNGRHGGREGGSRGERGSRGDSKRH